jgi:hypothetical protein
VEESTIHGKGLFTKEPISKGEIVCIKGGHIFNRKTLRIIQQTLGPAESKREIAMSLEQTISPNVISKKSLLFPRKFYLMDVLN